jgi:IS1 family transposase
VLANVALGDCMVSAKLMFIDGLKKTESVVENSYEILEMDELYWFVFHKPRTKTGENVYLTTLVSRLPRQIVGFDVAFDKVPERLQKIIDNAPKADKYATDGFLGYEDVIYPGKHVRNVRNKSDTFTVESINADLRHYIPVLARRSRCFARTLDTLLTVVTVFVEAYNKFGQAKMLFRQRCNLVKESRELPFGLVDFF